MHPIAKIDQARAGPRMHSTWRVVPPHRTGGKGDTMSKISITATVALSLASAMAIAANGAPKYQPFPDGYGYMDQGEIKALMAAVAAGDHKKVREHGWKLWAGIMQPDADGQWPIWYTWPNTKAAFAPSSGATLTASAAAGPGKSLIRLNAANNAGQSAAEPPIDPPS